MKVGGKQILDLASKNAETLIRDLEILINYDSENDCSFIEDLFVLNAKILALRDSVGYFPGPAVRLNEVALAEDEVFSFATSLDEHYKLEFTAFLTGIQPINLPI